MIDVSRMLSARRVLTSAALFVVLGAGSAHGQTSPPTVLPPPGAALPAPGLPGQRVPPIPPAAPAAPSPLEPGSAGLPPVVDAALRPPAWTCSMGLGIAWDDNIDASLVGGPSAWGGLAGASLSYLHARPGGQVRLSASGSGTAYRSLDVYNRPGGGASVDGRWSLSRTVAADWSASYAYGHTDNSEWLVNQGVIYGLSAMQTYAGSAGLSWRVASQTVLRVDARGVATEFESEALSASGSVRGSLGLNREVGRRDSLGLESAVERVTRPDLRDTLYASVRWRHQLSPRTGLFLEGGLSRTAGARPGELAQARNFYGGASVNRQVGGRSVVSAGYRREVVPLFGVSGVRLVDRFHLAFSANLGRSWFAGLTGTYALDADRAADGTRSSGDGQATVGLRLGRHWRLSVVGRYRRSEGGELALREAYRVGGYVAWESTARP